MTEPTPQPTAPPRPWYQRWWGIVYLVLLAITSVAILVIAVAMPSRDFEKFAALMIPGMLLDVMLAIAIGFGIFRRRFWRIPTAPIADVFVSLLLFAPCIYVVWTLVFVMCMFLG